MDGTDIRADETLVDKAHRAISDHLRAERARAGLTQAQLAEKSGLAEITIYRLEKNQRKMTLTQLFAIADALGVKPGDFLDSAQSHM
ncbi:helix-turn-helix domain-containing protein [Nocardia nova]|jgi:transcriptional regulator with XRE-family HTH domain|uniref:helix-turn-helix domain-containing protein n=1 Tax=Nocardia nova TaxID=37330 RepID=UPI001893F2DE|nr:helix-turn-helix transcriptional regulator [Nocardia nova]MBF6276995.1 helix-turn-helix transcriptional regulator [Nocardia nova]